MRIHAPTAEAAWRIARQEAEAYQRKLTRAANDGRWAEAARCQVARDAADRIALRIRYGRRNP